MTRLLNGDKKHLSLNTMSKTPIPPRLKGVVLKNYWNRLKKDPGFRQYFPDKYFNNCPTREFFLTVELKRSCLM